LLPVAGIAALTSAVVGLIVWLYPWSARPARNWTLSLGEVSRAVVSPDGSAVLYPTAGGLVLRRLDSLGETLIYNREAITDIPEWSPDGSQILFDTTNGLVRMGLPDGQPVTIWRGNHITRGYSWGPGGVLMATLGNPSGGELYLLPAEGGTPLVLGMPGLTNGRFFYPEFLPDGENILFAWAGFEDADAGLYLATIRNRKVTRGPLLLRRNQTAGHYSSSGGGRLLFVADDKLYAQRLDISRGTLEGEPERIVDGVHSMVGRCRASFSVSRGGVLVWRAGRASLAQLTWFDRTGKVLGIAGPLHVGEVVRLSPDEKHILIPTSSETAGYSVVESNQTGRLVMPGVKKPVWLPDSSHILYVRKEGTTFRLLERAAGGGAEKEVARLPEFLTLYDLSADGKVLLYRAGFALYTLRFDGSQNAGKPQMVAQAGQGKLSPDGRWVVYSWNLDGSTRGVYVQPLSAGSLRSQIRSAHGYALIWRRDGKEILFIERSIVYSVSVDVTGETFHASPPEALFKIRASDGLSVEADPLAVTHDGSRILFAQGVEQPDPQLTYVMTAWDTMLKR
jgi:Tol biopolymer transport system component